MFDPPKRTQSRTHDLLRKVVIYYTVIRPLDNVSVTNLCAATYSRQVRGERSRGGDLEVIAATGVRDGMHAPNPYESVPLAHEPYCMLAIGQLASCCCSYSHGAPGHHG